MNRRDRELLQKQLRNVSAPPRNDGALMLAVVAVFLAGMTAGSFLYAFTDQPPVRVASNDAVSPIAAAPHTGQSITR
jgi:hypothetical protein